MDLKELTELMRQLVVPMIVILCMSFGYLIKTSLDFIENKYIPLILSITGVLCNIWQNRGEVTLEIVISGVVSGLASVGTFELIRNLNV